MCVCVLLFSGFLTDNSYDFANSWAVKGAEQSCRRVSNPSKTCNNTEETSMVKAFHTYIQYMQHVCLNARLVTV